MLNSYITATQLLLHDTNANFYSVSSLTSYINTARGRVAADAQCVRVLPPSSAAPMGNAQSHRGRNTSSASSSAVANHRHAAPPPKRVYRIATADAPK